MCLKCETHLVDTDERIKCNVVPNFLPKTTERFWKNRCPSNHLAVSTEQLRIQHARVWQFHSHMYLWVTMAGYIMMSLLSNCMHVNKNGAAMTTHCLGPL